MRAFFESLGWLNTALISVVLALSPVLDTVTGLGYDRTATSFAIPKTPEAPHRLIVHLPGFIGNQWPAHALAPYLTPHGTVVGVQYAQTGFNAPQIFAVLAEELRAQYTPPTEEVWVLAQSMGAKVFRDFAAWLANNDPELLAWLKNATLKLVLDTAPASEADIKIPALGMRIAEGLNWLGMGSGAVLTKLAVQPYYRNKLRKGYPDPIGVDPAIVQRGHDGVRNITAGAIVGQAAFLSRLQLPTQEEFAGLVDDAIFVHGQSPADDPIINVAQAIEHWRAVFPQLRTYAVKEWEGVTHSPNLERPREYAGIVIREFS